MLKPKDDATDQGNPAPESNEGVKNFEEMGPKDLETVNIDDPKLDEPKPGEPKPGDEKPPQSKKVDGDEKPPAGTGDEPPKPSEDDPWEKRYKDLQSYSAKRENELREENERLKKAEEDKKIEAFEKERMSEEDLDALKVGDPDAYITYKQNEAMFEQMKKDREEEVAQAAEVEQAQTVGNFILDTFEASTGVKIDRSLPFDKQPAEIKKALEEFDSDRIVSGVNKFFEEQKVSGAGENGVYTRSQLDMAYRMTNFDDIVANERVKTRENIVNDANRAAGGQGVFSGNPPDGDGGGKNYDEMTQEEIEQLTPEETKKALERAGLTEQSHF